MMRRKVTLTAGLLAVSPAFGTAEKPGPRTPSAAPQAAPSASHGNPLIDFVRRLLTDSGVVIDGTG